MERINEEPGCEEHSFRLLFETMGAVHGLLSGMPWTGQLARIGSDFACQPTRPKRRSTAERGKVAAGSSGAT